MNKVYMIEILCKDDEKTIYNDNYKIGYIDFDKAREKLDELIKQEYEDLKINGNDYYICDYNEDNKYEREIWVETKDYESMITRYTIVEVEIDNKNIRYDMEEKFPINDTLLKTINGMIYKGIEVDYIYDTNTLVFCKANQIEKTDDNDIDTIVYRNYDEKYIIDYIETQLNNFIKDEYKNKKIYHLHNTYGEYNEYTTDKNKIIMIYIDEVAQCVENNLRQDEEQTRYAENWLTEIMMTCSYYIKEEVDDEYINKITNKLNKEHYWCIEIL